MNLIENVSRRHFLGATLSTSAFVLAAQVLLNFIGYIFEERGKKK